MKKLIIASIVLLAFVGCISTPEDKPIGFNVSDYDRFFLICESSDKVSEEINELYFDGKLDMANQMAVQMYYMGVQQTFADGYNAMEVYVQDKTNENAIAANEAMAAMEQSVADLKEFIDSLKNEI